VAVEIFGSKRLGGLTSHGKILFVDGRVAVVGSLALTAISLEFRREIAIVVDAPAAVAEIARLFESLDGDVAARTGPVRISSNAE
jgi:phosphatidylserine/phosphatidylglycerophosphate/cardiolipin synthase-like enzyme